MSRRPDLRGAVSRPAYAMHTPRTKIVCTLGPASSTREQIHALATAGMNVARINFSHGTHEQHAETIRTVRSIADELQRPLAILGDLQGPRIRIGDLAAPRELEPGVEVVLVHEGHEQGSEIPVTYDALAKDVKVGDRILINDGLIELTTVAVSGDRVRAKVVYGGIMTSHKGINLPGVQVSAPALTDKDKADVAFAVQQELDYVALSFVRKPDDIRALRQLIPRQLLVIAKIEKDIALRDIEAILLESDGVMVARGDLGVELPFEEVPLAQKKIIALANRAGRPVITATQMLESMIGNPRPTRAEASDVANAIVDGTDAVMLSAETAAGQYPTLAVEAMHRIIVEVEQHWTSRGRDERRGERDTQATTEETIAASTVTAVKMLHAPCIIVFTKSGVSARTVSSHRPGVPIMALTDSPRTWRQLSLVWGVVPALGHHCESYDEMVALARTMVVRHGLASTGDRVIVTAGVPFDVPGTTNSLKVEMI